MLPAPSVSASTAGVIYVAVDGDDAASGAIGDPVRTIAQAVQMGADGVEIEIGAGSYHESVQVYSKEVHLRPAPGAEVILDGSSKVSNWTRSGDRWWSEWDTEFIRVGEPFTTPERPEAGWPEQFFVDDRNLEEVASIGEVASGTFFYDRTAGRVWIGEDPSGHVVAGSTLNWGLYLNLANGSSVSGITVQRYATQSRNMAAIRAYADDLRISDVTVIDNAHMGVSVIGDRVRLDDVRSVANGHLGIHSHRSDRLVISGVDVRDNNREGYDAFHSAGGIKVTDSTKLTVQGSRVSDNGGPGVWTDLDARDVIIASNLVTGNARSGIEIELSSQVIVVNNTVHSNDETGIWVLESSDVEVWHNSVMHNVRDIWIEDGPRSDVNDVTVVNNLLGGDAGADAAGAILNVDDWTEQRGGDDMNIDLGSNRYWLVPEARTTAVSRWASWPYPLRISTTMAEHRTATSSAQGSDLVVSVSDPFSRSETDSRPRVGAADGRVPTAAVAAIVGTTSASPIGPLTSQGAIVAPDPGSPTPPAPSKPGGPSTVIATPVVARSQADPVELGRVRDTRDGGESMTEIMGITGIGGASLSGALLSSERVSY